MMRLPDFEGWAMFAAVAQHRSFTEAARTLGVSKATVSKAVSRLEAHLETSLFSRTSRHLSLTESGRRLAEHAARILGEGEAAEEAAREETAALTGHVKLGAPMTYGIKRVAPLLAEFQAEHPGIVVDLHLSDARVDIIDLGLDATLRIAEMPDSSLRARRLRDVTMHIIAAPAYLERRGTSDGARRLILPTSPSMTASATPMSSRARSGSCTVPEDRPYPSNRMPA
jgi:DNA-binding transcriptional LysR family regulator